MNGSGYQEVGIRIMAMGTVATTTYTQRPESCSHTMEKAIVYLAGLLGGDVGHESIVRPESKVSKSNIVAVQGRLYWTDIRLYLHRRATTHGALSPPSSIRFL